MHRSKTRALRRTDAWDAVSPKGQIFASLAVLVPVALSGLALVAFAPAFWWIFTTYFWVSFPALGLLGRGVAGLVSNDGGPSTDDRKERELLEALLVHQELAPARAAMETSLTVAEADRILRGLAESGHLEVRARGGALFYALWETTEGRARGAMRETHGEPRMLELRGAGPGEKRKGAGHE